jgi:hypothetical protein
LLEIYNQVQSGQALDEKLVSESFIKSQIDFFALQQWIDKKPVFRRLLNVMKDEAFFKLSPKERAINNLSICTKDYLSNLGSKFQAKVVEIDNEKITRRQLFTNIWKPINSAGDSNNQINKILARLKQPDMAPIYMKVKNRLANNSPENQELLGSIYALMVSEDFVGAEPDQQVKMLQSIVDYQIPIGRRNFFTWLTFKPLIELWKVKSLSE